MLEDGLELLELRLGRLLAPPLLVSGGALLIDLALQLGHLAVRLQLLRIY